MEFFRQEYWSGLSFPISGGLLDPGIKPEMPASSALAGGFFTTASSWEAIHIHTNIYIHIHTHTYIYPYMNTHWGESTNDKINGIKC